MMTGDRNKRVKGEILLFSLLETGKVSNLFVRARVMYGLCPAFMVISVILLMGSSSVLRSGHLPAFWSLLLVGDPVVPKYQF